MLLLLGILLWSVTHLFVALGVEARGRLIAQLGQGPYKLMFTLVLIGALVLIILGWRATPPTTVWLPPPGLRHVTMLLMPIAVILFFSSRMPTDIKQLIRHPQLTGVKLWAVAHLLSNGETRSLILFGGLLAWAVLEVIFINRRDGAWKKPAPIGMTKTLVSAVVGLVITVALMFGHPWLAGMPVISGG